MRFDAAHHREPLDGHVADDGFAFTKTRGRNAERVMQVGLHRAGATNPGSTNASSSKNRATFLGSGQ
jgi:hypothetical protein